MAALNRNFPHQSSSLGSQLYESFYDFFTGLYTQSFTNGGNGDGGYPGDYPAQTRMSPSSQRYREAENQPPRRPNGQEQQIYGKEAQQTMPARQTVPFGAHAALDEIDWPDSPHVRRQSPPVDLAPAPQHRVRATPQAPQAAARGDREELAADPEDLLDQHVNYYLRKRPEVCSRHTISRNRQGVYQLDGREVEIQWQYSSQPGGQGFLVVVDGPLRQPFTDYMENTEANASWEGQDIGTSSLHLIPRERRISFNDTHKVYNRLEAMKVAKEQALFREKAANFVKEGQTVPRELMVKYKKNIQLKLGQNRRPANPREREDLPLEAPEAPPAPVAPVAPVASAAPAAPVQAERPNMPMAPRQAPPAPNTPNPTRSMVPERSPVGLAGSPAPMQWPSFTPSYSPAATVPRPSGYPPAAATSYMPPAATTSYMPQASAASYAPPMMTRPFAAVGSPGPHGTMMLR